MKWVAVVCLVLSSPLSAEEPEAVYKQGIAKLRDAQSDHAALVPATKLLAQAATLYEAAGDEAKCAEVNSCLYWAKKKFTLADTQAVKTDAQVSQRIETVAKAIPASEAKAMLDKAEAFAKGHSDDPLLTAIRYFEVGDRFPETAEGRKAIQQSLAAMQKVGEKAKLEAYKPAPTDGKAFIKSEPVGAAIILVNADGAKLDTGKVTPALVQLPVGRQSLELTLKAHKAATLAVEVDGKTIAKPDAVKMEALTVPVDIIFDDGWAVFVDGKPAKASGTGKAETPCTVELPLGRHDLALAKEGFMDVKQAVEIVEGGVKSAGGMPTNSVEIKTKPSKGTSSLAKALTDRTKKIDMKGGGEKADRKDSERGEWISKDATYTVGSQDPNFDLSPKFLSGDAAGGFAFHTLQDRPFVIIDMKGYFKITSLEIVNRKERLWQRCKTLTMWVSDTGDGPWAEVWKASDGIERWDVTLPNPVFGRYVKLGLKEKVYFHLFSAKFFGEKKP